MPNYKVVNADQLDTDLTTVSDAIQAKAGTSEQLVFPDGFVSAIGDIQTGGGVLPDNAYIYYKDTAESLLPGNNITFNNSAVSSE